MLIQRARWLILPLVILTAVTSCSRAPMNVEATPTAIPTPLVPTKPTYEVERGEVVNKIEFAGRVAPVVEEALFFRTPGYVRAVNVERDSQVKQGQILAELEVTDLKNQLALAEASLKTALSNNDQRSVEAKAALHNAELHLSIAKASDPSPQIAMAQVTLERAQTALKYAQDEYNKAVNRTWEPEDVRKDYARAQHEAELDLKIAQAQYDQALQARQVYNYTVQLQEQEVASARLQLDRLESGLDVEEVKLTVERLKAQVDEARLIAPFDGQALSVNVMEGDAVEAYQVMVIVGNPSELELTADVDAKQMEKMEEGMPVTCVVASAGPSGEAIPCRIRRMPRPYVDDTANIKAKDSLTHIAFENPSAVLGLQIGDRLQVTIVLERRENVLWLPPQAIRTFDGRKFVVVQDSQGQRRMDVKPGIESEDRIEIKEGLTEGQVVIGP